jgi:hypothetical protein
MNCSRQQKIPRSQAASGMHASREVHEGVEQVFFSPGVLHDLRGEIFFSRGSTEFDEPKNPVGTRKVQAP